MRAMKILLLAREGTRCSIPLPRRSERGKPQEWHAAQGMNETTKHGNGWANPTVPTKNGV